MGFVVACESCGKQLTIPPGLYEKRVRYSYLDDEGGIFGGDGEVERYTSEETLGWSRLGLGVELGGTHDWF